MQTCVLWGKTAVRRKSVVFMNEFNCISRIVISLLCSLETFHYTLLNFMRKLYSLEVIINVEIHTGLMGPWVVLGEPGTYLRKPVEPIHKISYQAQYIQYCSLLIH